MSSRCRACNRKLSSDESLLRGIGHVCLSKRQSTSGQTELFEGLESSSKPLQLAEPEIVDWDLLRVKRVTGN